MCRSALPLAARPSRLRRRLWQNPDDRSESTPATASPAMTQSIRPLSVVLDDAFDGSTTRMSF
jgi:hypothetical protein